MRKSRTIVPLLAPLLLAAGLVGCAETTGADGTGAGTNGEIAFFTVSGQVPLINSLAEGVTAYLEGEGYTVSVQDANFDPVKQAQQIQQAVETKSIVAAWVFPVAPESLPASLGALQAAGIPAVVEAQPAAFGFDGGQPGLVFDAADFVAYGEAIGEAAAACAADEGGTGALFLKAPDTAGGSAQIVESIESAYTAAGGAPIVGTASAPDPSTAQTAVSQLLIGHPDADVVIAASDETAMGAIGAYRAAGKAPACLIAGGGGPDVRAAFEAGDITGLVSWDYTAAIEQAGTSLIGLIADPSATGEVVDTPVTVSSNRS